VRLTVKAIRFVIPGEIRVFDTSETAAARAWITARPGSRTDIGALPLRVGRHSRHRPRSENARPSASTRRASPRTVPKTADGVRSVAGDQRDFVHYNLLSPNNLLQAG
jgi:hypothetical protein